MFGFYLFFGTTLFLGFDTTFPSLIHYFNIFSHFISLSAGSSYVGIFHCWLCCVLVSFCVLTLSNHSILFTCPVYYFLFLLLHVIKLWILVRFYWVVPLFFRSPPLCLYYNIIISLPQVGMLYKNRIRSLCKAQICAPCGHIQLTKPGTL